MLGAVTATLAFVALISVAATVLLALRSRRNPKASKDGMLWRLPLIVWASIAFLLLALMIWDANASLLYFLLIGPVLCFALLLWLLASAIRKKPLHCLSILLALAGLVGVSWGLLRIEGALRPRLRWLLRSGQYKAELLRRPVPADGELKHLEWDAWGFVPTGFTLTYLVFDPSDSLASAAKSKMPGKFGGIPCRMPVVLRLEKQWYAVTFYTDESWNSCPSRDYGTGVM